MITCLFATYNGAAWLPKVLEGYCRLQQPKGGWKLVVVDNGSADKTSTIIRSFSSRLPLEHLWEPRRGKNAALNTGLELVEGDLVVLTDDDAIPKTDWLVQFRSAADNHRDFTVFGGVVLPLWETPPPDWLLRWASPRPTFALTDPAWEEGPIRPLWIFGPNMAVRAEVFEQGYRFNTSVGPQKGRYAMGSETEFTSRLARAGFRCWHCKAAVVEHIIRSSQMEKAWVLDRALRYGRGYYRMLTAESLPCPKLLFGFPRYLIRELIEQWMRLQRLRLTASEQEIFKAKWRLRFLIGQILGGRDFHRQQEA